MKFPLTSGGRGGGGGVQMLINLFRVCPQDVHIFRVMQHVFCVIQHAMHAIHAIQHTIQHRALIAPENEESCRKEYQENCTKIGHADDSACIAVTR